MQAGTHLDCSSNALCKAYVPAHRGHYLIMLLDKGSITLVLAMSIGNEFCRQDLTFLNSCLQ